MPQKQVQQRYYITQNCTSSNLLVKNADHVFAEVFAVNKQMTKGLSSCYTHTHTQSKQMMGSWVKPDIYLKIHVVPL